MILSWPAIIAPLAQAREVHALLDARESLGKLVLQP